MTIVNKSVKKRLPLTASEFVKIIIGAQVGAAVALNVLDFGPSVGTGGDDTAAIQSAVNNAVSHGAALVFPTPPAGFYTISNKIEINDSFGWALIGASGRAVIRQTANNTPIFHLNTKNLTTNQIAGFRIQNFQGQWLSDQPYGNLLSTVVEFDSDAFAGGMFDFIVENIENLNGCRCVAIRQYYQSVGFTNTLMIGTLSVWGCEFRHIRGSFSSSGSAVNLNNPPLGQPNVKISHVYLNQNTTNCKEEAIIVSNVDGLMIDNLELNFTHAQFMRLGDCRNTHIRCIRAESATINGNNSPTTGSTALLALHNCQQTVIEGISFQNCTKSANVNLIAGDGTTQVFTSGFIETTPTGSFAIKLFQNLDTATCLTIQLPVPITASTDGSGTLWMDPASARVLKVGT